MNKNNFESLIRRVSTMCLDDDKEDLSLMVADLEIVHERMVEIISYDEKDPDPQRVKVKYKNFVHALQEINAGRYPVGMWERWAVEYLFRHTEACWISTLLSSAASPANEYKNEGRPR